MIERGVVRLAGLAAAHGFETRRGTLNGTLPSPALRLRQVHGSEVLLIDPSTELQPFQSTAVADRPCGDALITQRPDVTLAIATADCLPALAFDVATGSIGAAHAGWRGIATGVIPAMMGAMAREFGTEPRNCFVALGPCIGADVYRVADDVMTSFRAAGVPMTTFTQPRDETDRNSEPHRTWLCDLVGAARFQLQACGVDPVRLHASGRCTFSEPDDFHSYRRDGDAAGRMLSGIALTR
jgi:YfiH family protein